MTTKSPKPADGQEQAAKSEQVSVALVGSSYGAEDGDVIKVDADRAAVLIAHGAARPAEDG